MAEIQEALRNALESDRLVPGGNGHRNRGMGKRLSVMACGNRSPPLSGNTTARGSMRWRYRSWCCAGAWCGGPQAKDRL